MKTVAFFSFYSNTVKWCSYSFLIDSYWKKQTPDWTFFPQPPASVIMDA